MSEDEFIARIRSLKERGIIRRFGATLRHQEVGFSSNAMVAWIVPDDRVEEVGDAMAQFQEVTHCYHRKPHKNWPYTLYTMIHGDGEKECRHIAEKMAQQTGIHNYALLFSKKEFKKTSMAYF